MKRFLPQFNGGQALIYLFIIIAITMMITTLISAKAPKLRQEKLKYFIYIIVHALFLVIFESILYNLKGTMLSDRFTALQIYFLVAGTIHLILFQFYFKKFETTKIYLEISIAFITTFFIAGFLLVIVSYYKEMNYVWYLIATLLFFVIPTMCYTLFETAISVPAKLHKRWFYPINSRYPPPQISEMRNVIIINFVFQKKANDSQIINFKVKAPKAIDFGRLFYYFINDYNEKNPGAHIKYLDENDQPYGWYFHTKPKWFSSSDYIDADVAIDTNNLKDGDTIICQRI